MLQPRGLRLKPSCTSTDLLPQRQRRRVTTRAIGSSQPPRHCCARKAGVSFARVPAGAAGDDDDIVAEVIAQLSIECHGSMRQVWAARRARVHTVLECQRYCLSH